MAIGLLARIEAGFYLRSRPTSSQTQATRFLKVADKQRERKLARDWASLGLRGDSKRGFAPGGQPPPPQQLRPGGGCPLCAWAKSGRSALTLTLHPSLTPLGLHTSWPTQCQVSYPPGSILNLTLAMYMYRWQVYPLIPSLEGWDFWAIQGTGIGPRIRIKVQPKAQPYFLQ